MPIPAPAPEPRVSRGVPSGAPEFPAPRPVAPGVLAGALTRLSLSSPELMLLALEKENTRLGVTAAQNLIEALGKSVAAEHVAMQEQLQKAMAAAQHKSWWQKFLIAFKVIAIAASAASGGWLGALAAGLMVAAWALEKSHPKVALGLQLAAVTILVSSAATEIMASSANVATGASSSWRAGTKYVAGGAQVGCAVGTAMAGHYEGAELRAEAVRLLAKQLLEQAQQGQRDEIAFVKALLDQDARVTRDCVRVGDERNAATAATIRV